MTKRYRVQLTRGSKADLRSIETYLEGNSGKTVADSFLREMLDTVDRLATFPDRGSIPIEVESLNFKNIRQLSRRPYRIIYQVVNDKVNILMIVDGRRDIEPLLMRRLLR